MEKGPKIGLSSLKERKLFQRKTLQQQKKFWEAAIKNFTFVQESSSGNVDPCLLICEYHRGCLHVGKDIARK